MRIRITVEKIPYKWEEGRTYSKLTFETTSERFLKEWADFWKLFYLFLGYAWGSIQEILAKLDWR